MEPVDLSSAVEANGDFPQNELHRILQANVRHLPFAEHRMTSCSLGVISTPDPRRRLQLYAQTKPGGWLVIDHYARNLSWYTKTAPLFRMVMRRMPPETAMRWSQGLVALFFPLHRAARGNRVAQALVSRVSPVLTYYHSLPLPDDLQPWSAARHE
jgi:hypothetical protein